MRNLSSLNNQELKSFFNSFQLILSDMDGVLWNFVEVIPQTTNAIKSLKSLGKKVIYVTNNTGRSHDFFLQKLKDAGFHTEKDELITPTEVMIDYLKKKNLATKKIFLLGMTPLRTALEEAGFSLAENMPDRVPELMAEVVKLIFPDDGTVGAVISDVDLNLNYPNILKALTYLKRPEVEFISGPGDRHMPLGRNIILPGPGQFKDIIEECSKRKSTSMAKNGTHMNDFIKRNVKEHNPESVLFIGDSVPEDMSFGKRHGYKTLLVLSGLATKETLENWTYPEEWKPDFYVEHLGKLHDMIQQVYKD